MLRRGEYSNDLSTQDSTFACQGHAIDDPEEEIEPPWIELEDMHCCCWSGSGPTVDLILLHEIPL